MSDREVRSSHRAAILIEAVRLAVQGIRHILLGLETALDQYGSSAASAPTVPSEQRSYLSQSRGLLFLNERPIPSEQVCACIRIFNCYKNKEIDRQITDKRGRNFMEARLSGDSQGLPSGPALGVIELDAASQRLSISCSDRKDFYHQFKVTGQRARTNVCWPPLSLNSLKGTRAFAELEQRLRSARALKGGSARSARRGVLLPEAVTICFSTIGQGDHLGVEFATGSHKRLLQSYGLLGCWEIGHGGGVRS